MPLKKTGNKSRDKKREAKERLKRYHARQAAIKKYGKSKVDGKEVHHKDGNNTNNAPSNLTMRSKKSHGKKHGRGNGKRGAKGS